MFGSREGFSGSADQMALFSVLSNPIKMGLSQTFAACTLRIDDNLQWHRAVTL